MELGKFKLEITSLKIINEEELLEIVNNHEHNEIINTKILISDEKSDLTLNFNT